MARVLRQQSSYPSIRNHRLLGLSSSRIFAEICGIKNPAYGKNQKLQDYLALYGIKTKKQYQNGATWSYATELNALQRAVENNVTPGYVRPNGDSGFYENIATKLDSNTVIAFWSTTKKSDGKSELDHLIAANGERTEGNRHLYSLLNPAVKSMGLGHVGDSIVRVGSEKESDMKASTKQQGTYLTRFAANPSVLSSVKVSVTKDAMDAGEKQTAAVSPAKFDKKTSTQNVLLEGKWESSNSKVLTVDAQTGEITAHASGIAEVKFVPYVYDESNFKTLYWQAASVEITVDGGEVAPESAPEEPAPMPAPEVKSPFVDVPADYQFFKEILWMKDKGISTGWKEDTTFRPHNQTDRGTMAAFSTVWQHLRTT